MKTTPPPLDLIPTHELFEELVKRHEFVVLIGHKNDGAKGLRTEVRMGSRLEDDGRCDPRAAMLLLATAQASIARGMLANE